MALSLISTVLRNPHSPRSPCLWCLSVQFPYRGKPQPSKHCLQYYHPPETHPKCWPVLHNSQGRCSGPSLGLGLKPHLKISLYFWSTSLLETLVLNWLRALPSTGGPGPPSLTLPLTFLHAAGPATLPASSDATISFLQIVSPAHRVVSSHS